MIDLGVSAYVNFGLTYAPNSTVLQTLRIHFFLLFHYSSSKMLLKVKLCFIYDGISYTIFWSPVII